MSIKLKPGHKCGPVTVEIMHGLPNGKKAVMFEQDDQDTISLDFDEIDALIEYLTEQQERLR